uniref:Segmentation protein cap'n'collar n=1 Tax=Hemiscolopendra marginata TaxID=943146 RepID=A0A646QE32_9MYRI
MTEGILFERSVQPLNYENQPSQQDMDLIEVLLKQDIDLGVTREVFDAQLRREIEKPEELEKKDKKEPSAVDDPIPNINPWDGLNYTIDSETGEHVILPENEESGLVGDFDPQLPLIEDDLLTIASEFENLPLNDTLQLTDFVKTDNLEESKPVNDSVKEDSQIDSLDSSSLFGEISNNLTEGLEEELEGMIQTQFHMHPHGRPLQARVPYLRTISMEQRWQDLANILSLPLAESEMHSSLTMVHGQHHNFTSVNSPYSNIDNCSTILLRNASLAPPLPEISNNVSFNNDIGESPNLATAVASSLSALTNSSEPMGDSSCQSTYNADGNSLVYPHNHSEINQTTEGFLSSILNDEDLQLMDMAMNEVPYGSNDRYIQNQNVPGMYTLRMLENDDAMETSSDSAVSSMGSSERVSSMSDNVQNNCCHSEWMENASDSSHPEEQNRYYGVDYSQASLPSKYRPYEYYPPRPTLPSNNSDSNNSTEPPSLQRPIQPVAQKKYQLFGKRFPPEHTLGGNMYGNTGRNSSVILPEPMKYPEYPYDRTQNERTGRPPFELVEGATAIDPPEVKFSCSLEFARQHIADRPIMEHVQHNHSYGLPPESLTNPHKPTMRDKQKKKIEDENISRDEKRARSLKIPMTNSEIINLPMDEFNERLSKYDLTEAQLALIRDIRRRGKNKVAAQNCRKRKLDQIVSLADEVQNLQEVKETLIRDRQNMMIERQRLKDKFTQLYRHVFQSLRDPDGHPYSMYEYSLQQASNGNVVLVPQNGSASLELDPLSGAKAKKKDDTTD